MTRSRDSKRTARRARSTTNGSVRPAARRCRVCSRSAIRRRAERRMNGWLEPKYVGWLAHGFEMTLLLSACVIVSATLLGVALAMARNARNGFVTRIAALYVLVFRNSPLLVQLLFWYFGAATLLPQSWMEWLNTPHTLSLSTFTLAWPPFEFVAGWI